MGFKMNKRSRVNKNIFCLNVHSIDVFKYYFSSDTEVLIVSSSRDMLSTAIFPTHPYRAKTFYRNITFLPDPSIVKINGVAVAITSTDIFSHLLEAEVAL